MWIHGRTRGSVNTSVQMEHSVTLSSSFSADQWRAIVAQRRQKVDVGNFSNNESETERPVLSATESIKNDLI